MSDLISRQAAIDVLDAFQVKIENGEEYSYSWARMRMSELPSAQPERKWIPVKTRPMTEEERQEYSERLGYDIEYEEAVICECKMPDDGQEVWVCSKCGNVWQDTCVVEEGIGLEENGDWLDIVAWMPFDKPEPYREEGRE